MLSYSESRNEKLNKLHLQLGQLFMLVGEELVEYFVDEKLIFHVIPARHGISRIVNASFSLQFKRKFLFLNL